MKKRGIIMRIPSFIVITVLLISVWTHTTAAGEVLSEPAIELDNVTYDFGQVSEEEVVTHDFKVFNRGNAVLEIKQVKPG